MKKFQKILLLGSLSIGLLPGFAISQQKIDCRMVSANIQQMIQKAPDHVLTIVEDALVAAPGCTCEIVKTAITASKADADLVQKIVYTAVKTSQQHAPIIAECAVAAAPQHADSVRAAFAEAFEDQPRTTSKKPTQVAEAPKPQTGEAPRKKEGPASVPAPVPVVTTPRSAETPQVTHQAPEMVVSRTASGKEVVEIGPTYAYDPKGVVIEEPQMDLDELDSEEPFGPFGPDTPYQYPPLITFFGGPPMDMTGLYLVPPVASAPPFDLDEPSDEKTSVRSVSTTTKRPPTSSASRKPRPRKPKPPVISRPISPTGP